METINKKPAAEFWKEVEEKRSAFEMWTKQVAGMPAEKQVKAVVKRLQDLNPGFDGKETHKIDGGVVTELKFATDDITDISPVRALHQLKRLSCDPSRFDKKTSLSDLSPLKGMLLSHLSCFNNLVSDLSPLEGMSLTYLDCGATQVSNLTRGSKGCLSSPDLRCGVWG